MLFHQCFHRWPVAVESCISPVDWILCNPWQWIKPRWFSKGSIVDLVASLRQADYSSVIPGRPLVGFFLPWFEALLSWGYYCLLCQYLTTNKRTFHWYPLWLGQMSNSVNNESPYSKIGVILTRLLIMSVERYFCVFRRGEWERGGLGFNAAILDSVNFIGCIINQGAGLNRKCRPKSWPPESCNNALEPTIVKILWFIMSICKVLLFQQAAINNSFSL